MFIKRGEGSIMKIVETEEVDEKKVKNALKKSKEQSKDTKVLSDEKSDKKLAS